MYLYLHKQSEEQDIQLEKNKHRNTIADKDRNNNTKDNSKVITNTICLRLPSGSVGVVGSHRSGGRSAPGGCEIVV